MNFNLLLRGISDSLIMNLMLGKFKEIENQFRKLKEEYQNRKISDQEFKDRLKALRIIDKSGRCWTIGAKTGRWYYFDGASWVEGSPPTAENGKGACHFCGFENQSKNEVCDYCGGDLNAGSDPDSKTSLNTFGARAGNKQEGRSAFESSGADRENTEEKDFEEGAVDPKAIHQNNTPYGITDHGDLNADYRDSGATAESTPSETGTFDTGRLETAAGFDTPRQGKEFTWESFENFGKGPDEEIEPYFEAGVPNAAIRSISPLSFLLFFGTTGTLFGLIFGVFLGISTFFAGIVAALPVFLQNQHGTLFGGGLFGLLGGVFGFAVLGGLGALAALLVNLILSLFGGVKVRIDKIG